MRGGFRVIEFTLTTPGALEWIERFAAREDLVVGAGTVLDRAQADDAVRAGLITLDDLPAAALAVLGRRTSARIDAAKAR